MLSKEREHWKPVVMARNLLECKECCSVVLKGESVEMRWMHLLILLSQHSMIHLHPSLESIAEYMELHEGIIEKGEQWK